MTYPRTCLARQAFNSEVLALLVASGGSDEPRALAAARDVYVCRHCGLLHVRDRDVRSE